MLRIFLLPCVIAGSLLLLQTIWLAPQRPNTVEPYVLYIDYADHQNATALYLADTRGQRAPIPVMATRRDLLWVENVTVSPDGRWIVFNAWDGTGTHPFRVGMHQRGTAERWLAAGHDDLFIDFFPGRQTALVASSDEHYSRYLLYEVALDGSYRQRISDATAQVAGGRFDFIGGYLVFRTVDQAGVSVQGLNLSNGTLYNLSQNSALARVMHTADEWLLIDNYAISDTESRYLQTNLDGSRQLSLPLVLPADDDVSLLMQAEDTLVYQRRSARSIHTYNLTTQEERQLTETPQSPARLHSTVGPWVYLSTPPHADGTRDIIRIHTTSNQRETVLSGICATPQAEHWNSHSARMLSSCFENDGIVLRALDLNTGALTMHTPTNLMLQYNIHVSPDGAWFLVTTVNAANANDLYRISADGQQMMPLTDTRSQKDVVAWYDVPQRQLQPSVLVALGALMLLFGGAVLSRWGAQRR